MRKGAISIAVLLLLLQLTAGCPHAASDPAAYEWSETAAQPRLPTTRLLVGALEIVAELARTPRQMAAGMMYRRDMAPDGAMLFIYPHPQRVSFYMRNTVIPLSCAYIDKEGIIREIFNMEPGDETPVTSLSDRIQFVLEVNRGWFEANNIGPGASVRSYRGTLQDLLSGSD